MSQKLQSVRGTHDLFPEDSEKYRYIVESARQLAARYGFGEIMSPIFEFTEVFQRTLGDTSDVVTKETYSFTDRGGESITLRPEFTASIARAFISHGLKDQLPLRYFYHGPAFRYERPQKGRQRQFHQCGVELLGSPEPQADVELIALAAQFLAALNIEAKLELNSLGDPDSRQRYRAALVEYYQDHSKDLSEDSQHRLTRNPLRILDSKDESDRKINQSAPVLQEHFSAHSQDFFAQLQEALASLGISFYLNPRLVRGLDYYSHTVFEFTTDALGAQNTLLAGGRYDTLIATMGGPDTAGIGWAAGIERLMSLAAFPVKTQRPIAIVPVGEAAEKQALALAYRLRKAGFAIEMGYRGNLSKRMKRADKVNAKAVVIIGEEELAKNGATIRNLDDGKQLLMPLDALEAALNSYKE